MQVWIFSNIFLALQKCDGRRNASIPAEETLSALLKWSRKFCSVRMASQTINDHDMYYFMIFYWTIFLINRLQKVCLPVSIGWEACGSQLFRSWIRAGSADGNDFRVVFVQRFFWSAFFSKVEVMLLVVFACLILFAAAHHFFNISTSFSE